MMDFDSCYTDEISVSRFNSVWAKSNSLNKSSTRLTLFNRTNAFSSKSTHMVKQIGNRESILDKLEKKKEIF